MLKKVRRPLALLVIVMLLTGMLSGLAYAVTMQVDTSWARSEEGSAYFMWLNENPDYQSAVANTPLQFFENPGMDDQLRQIGEFISQNDHNYGINTIWDNGDYYDKYKEENGNVGYDWASWKHTGWDAGNASVRRLTAYFDANESLINDASSVFLAPLDELGNISFDFPINDMIYVYVNGQLAYWGGTDIKEANNQYGAANKDVFDGKVGIPVRNGFNGMFKNFYPHTDGWCIDLIKYKNQVDIRDLLVSGENRIDLITDDYWEGGGMNRVYLFYEADKPVDPTPDPEPSPEPSDEPPMPEPPTPTPNNPGTATVSKVVELSGGYGNYDNAFGPIEFELLNADKTPFTPPILAYTNGSGKAVFLDSRIAAGQTYYVRENMTDEQRAMMSDATGDLAVVTKPVGKTPETQDLAPVANFAAGDRWSPNDWEFLYEEKDYLESRGLTIVWKDNAFYYAPEGTTEGRKSIAPYLDNAAHPSGGTFVTFAKYSDCYGKDAAPAITTIPYGWQSAWLRLDTPNSKTEYSKMGEEAVGYMDNNKNGGYGWALVPKDGDPYRAAPYGYYNDDRNYRWGGKGYDGTNWIPADREAITLRTAAERDAYEKAYSRAGALYQVFWDNLKETYKAGEAKPVTGTGDYIVLRTIAETVKPKFPPQPNEDVNVPPAQDNTPDEYIFVNTANPAPDAATDDTVIVLNDNDDNGNVTAPDAAPEQ